MAVAGSLSCQTDAQVPRELGKGGSAVSSVLNRFLARKALHDMQLAVDALQRGQSEEALRYLQDVQVTVAQIERQPKNPSKQNQER